MTHDLRPLGYVFALALVWVLGGERPVQAETMATSPPQIRSTIESVGLFKHGLAVVRRTLTLPATPGGVYDLIDLPEPVHGTFWAESSASLTFTSTHAEVPIGRVSDPAAISATALAGATVEVTFRQAHLAPLRGTIAPPPDPNSAWDNSVRPRATGWLGTGHENPPGRNVSATSNSLQLTSEQGTWLLNPADIAQVRLLERAEQHMQRRPVLRVHVGETDAPAQALTVSLLYLTRGAAWAPSYVFDLTHASALQMRQNAVIRNELEDWHDVKLMLITGHPNIAFGHVLSPLAPGTDLATFFRALSMEPRLAHSTRGDVMGQMVISNTYAIGGGADLAQAGDSALEGMDLHYHALGRHTLRAGESLTLTTARSEAAYERIVQWTRPDARDAWGQLHGRHNAPTPDDHAWDALRLCNPLSWPLTTAPAMVVERERVFGQSMLHWTAPGESASLPVNRTLSVRIHAQEHETEQTREEIRRYGRTYQRATVEGALEAVNLRREPVTLVATVNFSGELLEAAGEPETKLRAEGVWSVNPQREMVWNLTLEPGERKTLTYRYRVLAPR